MDSTNITLVIGLLCGIILLIIGAVGFGVGCYLHKRSSPAFILENLRLRNIKVVTVVGSSSCPASVCSSTHSSLRYRNDNNSSRQTHCLELNNLSEAVPVVIKRKRSSMSASESCLTAREDMALFQQCALRKNLSTFSLSTKTRTPTNEKENEENHYRFGLPNSTTTTTATSTTAAASQGGPMIFVVAPATLKLPTAANILMMHKKSSDQFTSVCDRHCSSSNEDLTMIDDGHDSDGSVLYTGVAMPLEYHTHIILDDS